MFIVRLPCRRIRADAVVGELLGSSLAARDDAPEFQAVVGIHAIRLPPSLPLLVRLGFGAKPTSPSASLATMGANRLWATSQGTCMTLPPDRSGPGLRRRWGYLGRQSTAARRTPERTRPSTVREGSVHATSWASGSRD